MRINGIEQCSMTNGVGLRTVLWVSGCEHKCKGCQNPCTWDPNSGEDFTSEKKELLYKYLDNKYIKGITFSGGDPLHPNNRGEVGKLILDIKANYPSKDIWLYTGYTWEEVKELNLDFLRYIDVLVDGRFILKERDINLRWCGSSNQRVIDVKESLKKGKIILFE